MRSAAYSIFTSVLLLAPISAVPLMAIFGVPQFAPVVASPLDDEDDLDAARLPRKPVRKKTSPNKIADDELDLFEDDALDWEEPTKNRLKPIKKPPSRALESNDEPTVAAKESDTVKPKSKPGKPRRPLPIPDDVVEFASSESSDDASSSVGNAGFEREVEASLPTESTPPAGERYRRTRTNGDADRPPDKAAGKSKRSTPSGDLLTWTKAVARLDELGIRNFKLEPGMRPGEFTFTCSYTPTNSPHVTRRFEAEADDPLKAVSQVLSQVERWAQQREATDKRTAERPREVN